MMGKYQASFLLIFWCKKSMLNEPQLVLEKTFRYRRLER